MGGGCLGGGGYPKYAVVVGYGIYVGRIGDDKVRPHVDFVKMVDRRAGNLSYRAGRIAQSTERHAWPFLEHFLTSQVFYSFEKSGPRNTECFTVVKTVLPRNFSHEWSYQEIAHHGGFF